VRFLIAYYNLDFNFVFQLESARMIFTMLITM